MSGLFLGSGLKSINDREVKQALEMMKDQLPNGVNIDDLAAIGDFQLNDGEALLTSEVLALSDELKEWIAEYEDVLKDIDTDLMKYVSSEGLAMFVNMDMNYLKKSV